MMMMIRRFTRSALVAVLATACLATVASAQKGGKPPKSDDGSNEGLVTTPVNLFRMNNAAVSEAIDTDAFGTAAMIDIHAGKTDYADNFFAEPTAWSLLQVGVCGSAFVQVSSLSHTDDSDDSLFRVRHYQGEVKLDGPGDRLVVSAHKCRKIYLNKTGYGGPAPRLQIVAVDDDGFDKEQLFDGLITGTFPGKSRWGKVKVIVSYPGKERKGRSDCYLHVESE